MTLTHHVHRFALPAVVALGIATLPAARAAESATEVEPVLIGAEVPNATLRNLAGEAVALPELVRGEKSILIFYRGGW
jgi:hypothetical protein